MKKIDDYLQQLGLSEIEAKLYRGLLEKGPTTVKDLAEFVGMKRITAHFNVENLISKGLITQSMKGARRQIIAESPERLQDLLEQKEDEIIKLKEKFPAIIKAIHTSLPKSQENKEVIVKYYEGRRSVFFLYEETLKYDEVYTFADLQKYYEVFPDTMGMFEEALEKNKKRMVWDILIDSSLARNIMAEGKYERYHTKFLRSSERFNGFNFADYIIFDNKVAIVQLDPHKPQATVIESKHMALSLKSLHEIMWELLPG